MSTRRYFNETKRREDFRDAWSRLARLEGVSDRPRRIPAARTRAQIKKNDGFLNRDINGLFLSLRPLDREGEESFSRMKVIYVRARVTRPF